MVTIKTLFTSVKPLAIANCWGEFRELKYNLHHLQLTTRNWYIYCDDLSHCALQRIPLCTGKYPHYYPGMFYWLLYTNHYFLDITLVSSLTHTHTQTHTHTHTHRRTQLKVLFSSLNSQTKGLAVSLIWNTWMSDKKLKTMFPCSL